MFQIDIANKKAVSLEKKTFSELKLSERYDLQEWIVDNPEILGEKLLIIQKEFDGFSDTNERLDLLALDEQRRLVVIENKLDDSGKDVVWQSLKYVSYCATLTTGEITEIYQRYLGKSADAKEKLSEFFDEADFENLQLNPPGAEQRIILVAATFRKEVTSTVLWLRDHGADITCIKITPFSDGDRLYLDTEQILPIKDTGDYQIRLANKRKDDSATGKHFAASEALYQKFWGKALPTLKEKSGTYGNVTSLRGPMIFGAIGIVGMQLNSVILQNAVRAELYIDTGDKDKNKRIFNALFARKDEHESAFGATLYWQEMPDRRACRISITRSDFTLNDDNTWDGAIEFFAENIAKLIRVFKPPLTEIVSKQG